MVTFKLMRYTVLLINVHVIVFATYGIRICVGLFLPMKLLRARILCVHALCVRSSQWQ